MKKLVKFICILSIALMLLSLFVACGGKENDISSSPAQENEVSSLTVKQLPDKTDYLVGEAFSGEGCILTVTYSDGSTSDVLYGDPGIEITAPSTETAGEKNVVVKYGGERTSFQVSVTAEGVEVVFQFNVDGKESETVRVNKGDHVAQPQDPTREGYDFIGWSTDPSGTVQYDFAQKVESPITLYAVWVDSSATKYTFTFELNHAGLSESSVVQQVVEGESAVRLAEDPARYGYEFIGWYTDADSGEEYDFSTPVSTDMSVYAHWNKTLAGEQTYVFEAEDTNLAGKSGPAFSGTAQETGMILFDTAHGASNDRFVGYLYQRYNSLEFYIISDESVDDVTLIARLSAEMRDYTYNKNNFSISVNGSSCDYGDINFEGVPENSYNSIECLPFEDYVISTKVSLKEGVNLITFMTENEDGMEGSTLLAAAPLVDCIKLKTSAVLTWSEANGLPADNY